jgi:hypothetical protein
VKLEHDDLDHLARDDEPRLERPSNATFRRRRLTVAGVLVVVAAATFWLTRGGDPITPAPKDLPGTTQWATAHYGHPNARHYRARHIVQIDFLGSVMFVNEDAAPHFLRLARIFVARAPEYAAAVAAGTPDDWSYANRDIRGGDTKSYHAFGLAIDVNALANPLGTAGDMPMEVVEEWEREGGAWGGRFSRPDPMHFETHLTPAQISDRYRPDGTVTPTYLEELVGG